MLLWTHLHVKTRYTLADTLLAIVLAVVIIIVKLFFLFVNLLFTLQTFNM